MLKDNEIKFQNQQLKFAQDEDIDVSEIEKLHKLKEVEKEKLEA